MKKRNFVLTGRRDKKKRKKPEGQRLSFDASRDQRVPSWTDANFVPALSRRPCCYGRWQRALAQVTWGRSRPTIYYLGLYLIFEHPNTLIEREKRKKKKSLSDIYSKSWKFRLYKSAVRTVHHPSRLGQEFPDSPVGQQSVTLSISSWLTVSPQGNWCHVYSPLPQRLQNSRYYIYDADHAMLASGQTFRKNYICNVPPMPL